MATRNCHGSKYGVINCKVGLDPPIWRTFYTHRLSFMFQQNLSVEELGDLAGDVSHLCHNSLCAAPDHLALEPHHINHQRNNCVSEMRCNGHQPYRDCLLDLKL